MLSEPRFMAAMSRFARLLLTPYEVIAALEELVESVTAVLDLAGAGVVVASKDRLYYCAASNEEVVVLERWQETERSGPCQTAFDEGVVIRVSDMSEHASEWPSYTELAGRLGVRAVAGIPMQLGTQKVGALNLYSHSHRVWTDDDIAVASVLADMATGYLIFSSTIRQYERLEEQLKYALETRAIIEQAKGITAHERGVSIDRAFDMIRQHARKHNAKIRDVCEAIVKVGLQVQDAPHGGTRPRE